MVRTPAENEQFVREHWPNVMIAARRSGARMFYMALTDYRAIVWNGYESPELAMAAAAEFTEQRLEEIELAIRALTEATNWGNAYNAREHGSQECAYIWNLLAAKLESLKEGMRS